MSTSEMVLCVFVDGAVVALLCGNGGAEKAKNSSNSRSLRDTCSIKKRCKLSHAEEILAEYELLNCDYVVSADAYEHMPPTA
ncbi:hypothetical protein Sjap_014043 [Stephania japonica]|uniref:Uncharacterized protein n=1 Tax=Stephania japonica TaxID=461633 RepID=A0AAP0J1L3_9MAGN